MDWRNTLGSEARNKIVKRIMNTLQKHMPHSPPDGMNELLKIACRLEEKIYMTATDQQDYLRKISVKMLSMENKSQNNSTVASTQNRADSLEIKSQNNSTMSKGPGRQGCNNYDGKDVGNMDWRSALGSEARNKIASRIMDSLQKHSPPDGMNELLKIACRLENKIYMTATDQQDYLRKISVKMLSLENKTIPPLLPRKIPQTLRRSSRKTTRTMSKGPGRPNNYDGKDVARRLEKMD